MSSSARITFFGTLGGEDERGRRRTDDAIVTDLEELLKQADQVRQNAEIEWYNNYLYLEGNQYEEVVWDDVSRHRKLPAKIERDESIKYVDNWVYSMVRQASSLLTAGRSRQVAVAASERVDDQEAAEAATDFLLDREGEKHDNEQARAYDEFLLGMTCGGCGRLTLFDPEATAVGRTGLVPNAGDISSITMSPFGYHLAPWLDEKGQVPWVIISDVVDVEELRDQFRGKKVEEEEYADALRVRDQLVGSITGAPGRGLPKRKKAAVRHWMLCRPSRRAPKGRSFIWANRTLLHAGPLQDGRFPMEFFTWFRIPGRLHGLPFITPMREPNKHANLMVSRLLELTKRQLRGDMAVEGELPVTEEIDPETKAKRIRIPYGSKFQFITYELRTSEAELMLAHLWNTAMQLAGMHEPTLGQLKGGMPTASHVLMLKEQDAAGLMVFRIGYDLTNSAIARAKLAAARDHFRQPRHVRVERPLNRIRTRYLLGTDLRNTEDVRPRPVPVVSEAQRAVIKEELISKQCWGPYSGPEDMLPKLEAILSSGLPNADEEVEQILGDMTISELRQIVRDINRKKIILSQQLVDTALEGAVLQRVSQWQGAQEQLAGGQSPVASGQLPETAGAGVPEGAETAPAAAGVA